MASLRDAEAARMLWSERLVEAGAHSTSVEAESPGARSFVVIAWVDKPPVTPLPTAIDVSRSRARRSVPLRVRMSAAVVLPEAPGGRVSAREGSRNPGEHVGDDLEKAAQRAEIAEA